MQERRKFIRVVESLKIAYELGQPLNTSGANLSQDIGEGGIRFTIEHRLRPGDTLDLEILIVNDKDPIVAKGEVAWVKITGGVDFRYMTGIKFIEIDILERQRLSSYIHKIIENKKESEISWLRDSEK